MSTDNFDPDRALQYADDLARRAREMEAEAKEIEIDVTSPDRTVTVTTTLTGKIARLKLSQQAMESQTSESLSAAVLRTIKQAQEASERAAKDLADRYLPEASKLRDVVQSRREQGRERP